MPGKKRKNPDVSGKSLGEQLKTKKQRELAQDIIDIRSHKNEPSVSIAQVIEEHNKRVNEGH